MSGSGERRLRVLIVCERLADRDDEGIRNVARALLLELRDRHDVLAFTQGDWTGEGRVQRVPMGRFFLNPTLLREAREFAPDVTVYVPWTSGTPPTFLRARILRYATKRPVLILLSQPYEMAWWAKAATRRLLPRLVVAMSDNVVRQLAQIGAETEFVPAGVDLTRFRVPTPDDRERERARLGFRPQEQIVLHVGHLNPRRVDAGELRRLARQPGRRVVMVGSTSTPQDDALVASLRGGGCTVMREYLPHIDRLYGAADVYLFPTRDQRSSIGVPLSVLEALACGIPVVSTRFEGLPRLFPATPFVRFASGVEQLERALLEAPRAPDPDARKLVEDLDWRDMARRVETHLLEVTR
jgi:glycosyltransferase involved in cell wall biosynthesis